jgi:hypothetical protein
MRINRSAKARTSMHFESVSLKCKSNLIGFVVNLTGNNAVNRLKTRVIDGDLVKRSGKRLPVIRIST